VKLRVRNKKKSRKIFPNLKPNIQIRGNIFQTYLMIDKTKIIDTVCERLEKLPLGHYIDLKTYKRNRTVIIVKVDEKKLLVIEDGYFKDRLFIKPDKLKKLLKILLKKEFPRSKKIRLYVMGKFVDEEALNTIRKII